MPSQFVTGGGAVLVVVAAGTTSADQVIKAGKPRLCRIVIVATGTAAVSLYDNATASSGTVLFTVPANAATGTIYDLQLPCANGITVGKVNNSPAMNVTYV